MGHGVAEHDNNGTAALPYQKRLHVMSSLLASKADPRLIQEAVGEADVNHLTGSNCVPCGCMAALSTVCQAPQCLPAHVYACI